MHHVVIPLDHEGRWILVTVTPARGALEPPGLVVVTEGSRQKCEAVRVKLLDETSTLAGRATRSSVRNHQTFSDL
jgi:hypothetical protein